MFYPEGQSRPRGRPSLAGVGHGDPAPSAQGLPCPGPGQGLRGAALGLCSLSPPDLGLLAIPREAQAAPLGFRRRDAL